MKKMTILMAKLLSPTMAVAINGSVTVIRKRENECNHTQ